MCTSFAFRLGFSFISSASILTLHITTGRASATYRAGRRRSNIEGIKLTEMDVYVKTIK
jgi:hypothetical protein